MEKSVEVQSDAVSQETWEERLKRIRIFDRDKVADRYCGFVDVLGFGAATLADLHHALELYEELLDSSEFLSSLRKNVRISVHSDSFVLVSDGLGDVIGATQALQWSVLMKDYLVRGAIAYGSHAEGEKSGVRFIVSAAISKAVALEKTVKWPCVALHPDIEVPDEWWFAQGRPLLYFDSLRIVSPFNKFWFQSAMTRVSQLLERYPEHAAKYNWFLSLYSAVEAGEQLVPPEVRDRLGWSWR